MSFRRHLCQKTWLNLSVLGSGLIGAATGVGFSSTEEKNEHEWIKQAASQKNNISITKRIVGENDKTGMNLRLYQYQTCPFCCKVRAFLDYFGFSYDIVEVNPVTRSQLKSTTNYKKVPVLVANDIHVLVESSLIVSILFTFLHRKVRSIEEVLDLFPELELLDKKKSEVVKKYPNKYFIMHGNARLEDSEIQNLKEEREWREWIDNYFVHLISPNVYRTLQESFATFHWFDEAGGWKDAFRSWERYLAIYVGAIAMFILSKSLKKRHGIMDERAELIKACNEWVLALGDRPFLGGLKPNLADLEFYGSMNSFVGCEAFRDICEQSSIKEWFDRMNAAVKLRAGSDVIGARYHS